MVIFFLIYSLLSSQSVNAYKSGQSVLVQTIAVVGLIWLSIWDFTNWKDKYTSEVVHGNTYQIRYCFSSSFWRRVNKRILFLYYCNRQQKCTLDKCLITVKIHDINDNSPIFDRSEYELTIDESQALPKTPLIQVHANELDDGINGIVKYSLVDRPLIETLGVEELFNLEYGKVQVQDFFKIDENTGLVSVGDKFSLDYEIMPTFRLTEVAKDNGNSVVYANVIIYLNDVNDNKPEVNLTFSSQLAGIKDICQGKKINISELILPNSNMAEIRIRDHDKGANGKIKVDLKQFKLKTCNKSQNFLEDSNDFGLILNNLNKNIYTLITKQKLDRKSFDKYILHIIATDHGKPALETKVKLEIDIKDENDNGPIFSQTSYEFILLARDSTSVSMSEDSFSEWIEVGRVTAVDIDLNENSQINYEINLTNQDKCFNY